MQAIKNEPILVSTITTIVSWVAAKFALDMDATTATAIATVVLLVGGWLARRFSVPSAKAEAAVGTALNTNPVANSVAEQQGQAKRILSTTKV